ncbi:membrane protein insertion efficiency factor YidD [Taylorella equigenitalis]|uniref:Putative membrane protein insertion efficiency factor n=1 Tax=Taylorella equigenitalis ATCC 35865 TaxID=743973 RepID=A0ABM5NCH3_9BURK|nr:membrane protein insertion efficiency factor YidD [Taylorella equigenitalis]AFN36646.1 hypothetical protein KUI_1608 [Taylorella equigenitalis ATCC 35865]ASY40044.1 membrane protein insertion efficiency factor YidD [Taylorella equigenitalis]WDU56357.1 membrane protein insertion efficiency factor YidD [Taylorella equigenitalis]VEG32871.1 Putative membrane protein insertion efficiency factor [Taylorella equigenitalis ATCC 35865]
MINKVIVYVLTKLITIYKFLLSPWMGNSCRFTPTCSTYMQTALEEHGALKGTYLGLKRICRCNPLFDGGIDPVPSKDKL